MVKVVPSVSVVIVAFDSGPPLVRCLESIAAGAHDEEVQVVVVNTGGDAPELREAARSPLVEVVSAGTNIGFAAACNLGSQHARGDVLVFLNPDTVVASGALATLVEAVEDPSVGIAMARLRLLEAPALLNSSGNVLHITGLAWSGGYGEPADGVAPAEEIAYPSGAAMAIRTDLFRELGGFREEFFLYHEDVDLGWRARMRGLRIVLVPADVFHDYEYARNPRKLYFLERNRLLFIFSAFSTRLLLVLAPLLVATEIALLGRALREGWLEEKLRGWRWCANHGRRVIQIRRETQAARRVSDRELAPFLTPIVDPGMLALPRLLKLVNPLLAGYWSFARRLL